MIAQFSLKLASLLQPYLFEICLAQIVTVLVLCSDTIDRCFRRLPTPEPFYHPCDRIRALKCFRLWLCNPRRRSVLKQFYLQINLSLRYPVILGIFIFIGVIAERMKRC